MHQFALISKFMKKTGCGRNESKLA